MMNFVDKFLNAITMYRLVLYGLVVFSVGAVIMGFTGLLSFSGWELSASALILVAVCNGVNWLLAKILKVPANIESASITALILFLILYPILDSNGVMTLVVAGVLSMIVKYILGPKQKHMFNPVAITALILDFSGSGMVLWWVGSLVMAPLTIIVGLLIVRKIRRFSLFLAFLLVSLAIIMGFGLAAGQPMTDMFMESITSWPVFFFGTIMLTEPFTTPPTKKLQILYGIIVGILFATPFHIGPIYNTPELALVIGNIFSYLVSSSKRLTLALKEMKEIAPGIYEISFVPNQKLHFAAGQYLEWTLPHPKPDQRGIRRYFTIASSPTEPEIKLGIKAIANGSSFKDKLIHLQTGDKLMATSLGGQFILPKDAQKKLVFIAGGIGVTPFRSMVKYLLDTKEKRDITLFYACNSETDFAYQDIFAQAEKELGMKVIYVVTSPKNSSPTWKGKTGYVTKEMLEKEVPDYADRMFYLSGPDAMVQAYKGTLKDLGVKGGQIITDYFPGF